MLFLRYPLLFIKPGSEYTDNWPSHAFQTSFNHSKVVWGLGTRLTSYQTASHAPGVDNNDSNMRSASRWGPTSEWTVSENDKNTSLVIVCVHFRSGHAMPTRSLE